MDKEIRLSFAQRIKGTLPEDYQPLITEAKEKDTPDFKYSFDSKLMSSLYPFFFLVVSAKLSAAATPYSKEGRGIMQLIRRKAPDEEVTPIVNSIQEQASGLGVSDPLIPSTDAFVTAICYVGSKSLSHVLSCIERSKERLLSIGPQSAAARRQIITSVMEYWMDQPGIGINIIDKLLNYTILTPISVIEWALVDKLAGGSVLSKSHIFEMISGTIHKVTNRMRQIVAARTQPGLVEPQLSVLDETLHREKQDMRVMFRIIEDSLEPIASGTNDRMIERSDDSSLQPENEIVRGWGKRWLKVFQRESAVEEAFITEALANAVPVGTTAPTTNQPAGDGEEELNDVSDIA